VIVVGLLSGTSVDAIDVAAASIELDGDEVTLRPLGHAGYPWPGGLRERILAVLPPAVTTAGEMCALDNDIGRAFASAATRAVTELAGGRAELIAVLGQTVFHDVRDGRCHGSLQLGQPAWVAEATGLPVASDLRSSDIAAGGHGAPLASTLDALLLAGTTPRAALNLGGIANVTIVQPSGEAPPSGDVLAFDTGPANCLLDLAAARVTGGKAAFDADGAMAAAGRIRRDLLDELAVHPYFAAAPPKTTGREVFGAGYLDAALARVDPVGPADLMATLTELTAITVAGALRPYRVAEVVVSGGGARNPVLLGALRHQLPEPRWRTSDELGLPSDAKEAYLVALLGALTWHGRAGTVPGGTGALHPSVLGRITPAPPDAPTAPRRLRLQ
jgi:anhydro-N-acetylmuramic acid kinase